MTNESPREAGQSGEAPPLIAKIQELKMAAYRSRRTEFLNLCFDFAQKLKEKYPDTQMRRAYPAFIGSTMPDSPGIIEDDFPGEDSVVKFLESLIGGQV